MTLNEQLENNNRDLLAVFAAGTFGAIPYAGSLIAELVKYIIPNQRIDRISKYVKELDERLSKIPIEKINVLLDNENFLDLIEEGFVQASRAISDERREYIANIVANGIQDETLQLQESKHLLKIIQDINDIEIVWLNFYYLRESDNSKLRESNNSNEFYEKHKKVLEVVKASYNNNHESLPQASIQISYHRHLIQHNLIEINDLQGKRGTDIDITYIKGWSKPTIFGRLLLKQIGLID
ncbi:MAG: hypothetical protein HYZ54_05770 [Ignavibacteriae bacterium]|nr:hypothetical protein [Ignavibacteriota bacterium]